MVVVLAAIAFPLYIRYERGRWSPSGPAVNIHFRSREYRGATAISSASLAGMRSIGRAPWPDGQVLTLADYPDHADYVPTGIVVETPAGSGDFRQYGLVGGP